MAESKNESPIVDENWWKMWRNRRYHVSIMSFFGLLNMYICRVNMSVAVVAMTKAVVNDTRGPDFNWSSSEKSIILSSFYYGYVPVQIFIGMLLKYISPHIVFGIGTALPGLLTLLTPLIATHLPLWVLVTSRVVMGLLQGVGVPCIIKFWTIWGPPLERSRLHGIAVAGAFVGTVVGLPVSGLLADHAGWESIFYVVGSVALLWYIIWLILIRGSPESDPFISKYEKNYIAITIEKESKGHSHPIPWLSIVKSAPIYGVLIASLGWGWGYVTMLTQLPQFLSDVMNFDMSKSGFLSALPYLTMTIMSLLAGWMADSILVRQLLTVTMLRKYFISVTMLFQAALIIGAAYIANPTANVVCITAGIGIGALSYSGIGINYIDVAPAFAAVIGGIGNTMTTLPGILSPLITGVLVQDDISDKDAITGQWRIVFFITAGMYVMGSIAYWFLGSAKIEQWSKFDVDELDSPTVGAAVVSEECGERTHTNDKVQKSQ
ncbi:hypothetical protein HA402_001590 [Bradysia odoriphaga]|nr:hypothetical protein HA402_001590 [Bradysia odoriphaga]